MVRDDLKTCVIERLADTDGVLVVDETGFPSKGNKSVGVHRQYSGTAGRIESCQIGVFVTYASAKERTLIDRELYLPEVCVEDWEQCWDVGVPEHTVKGGEKDLLKKSLVAIRRGSGDYWATMGMKSTACEEWKCLSLWTGAAGTPPFSSSPPVPATQSETKVCRPQHVPPIAAPGSGAQPEGRIPPGEKTAENHR